jgi:hypothetical protein
MKEKSTAICAGGAVRAEVAWTPDYVEAAYQLEIG